METVLPEWIMQGGSWALLAWVVYQLVSKIQPTIENNTKAVQDLSALVKVLAGREEDKAS